MKKLLLLLLLFANLPLLAQEELKDVGIAKYAVLEVLDNNIPLRAKNNENSQRLTHVFKNTVLFADKETQNYYRVELTDNNYAWIRVP